MAIAKNSDTYKANKPSPPPRENVINRASSRRTEGVMAIAKKGLTFPKRHCDKNTDKIAPLGL